MTCSPPPMHLDRFGKTSTAVLAAAAVLASAAPVRALAAQGNGIPIPPPADSTRQRITGEVTVPPDFGLSIFAAPPHLTYPTCLHPAGEGVVFVCTDPNLLFGRERGRGRILRFVDEDQDGVADRYTVFADSLDAVRGIVVDGTTVYVMHAPTLTAYTDTDGDGSADETRVLVRGLGFGLDDRNGDHSSNGLRMGLDGWIYVAVGDYGFQGATSSDGTRISMRRGGVVRVRPDGSELEIVARGTRNIYDIALDPQLRIFARDNNNNGQGWNSVFHYLPPGSDAGYPSRFRNFPGEIHPPLADFGAGAATTTLWVDEPRFPSGVAHGLLSADWALNNVYRHDLYPVGGSFRIEQEVFASLPRPVDLEVDEAGHLFIASLSGGSYDYAGEHVGYVLRLTPRGGAAGEPVASLPVARLVDELLSPSAARRLAAQRELLSRADAKTVTPRLEDAVLDRNLPADARTAALFTLKQISGAGAHAVIQRAASDPAMRAMALRALADRRGESADVPATLFTDALRDPDPFVRLHAVAGIARLARPGSAESLMRGAIDPDPTVAHVARNELARIGAGAETAALAALDTGRPLEVEAALHVLTRIHSPGVVSALASRLAATEEGEEGRRLVAALARLYHREGVWDGSWWGNQPSTEGPYFDPVPWEESPRIRQVLVRAVTDAPTAALPPLLTTLEREGLIPREGAALLAWSRGLPSGDRLALVDRLVGGRELRADAVALLESLAGNDAEGLAAAAAMVASLPAPPSHTLDFLAAVAADPRIQLELRGQALAALGRAPALERESDAVVSAYAAVVPNLPGAAPLLQPWRRYVGARERADAVERFASLASAGAIDERVLGYGVLVQVTALSRNPETTRARAAALIESAWADEGAREALVRAIRILGVEERYAEELARPEE